MLDLNSSTGTSSGAFHARNALRMNNLDTENCAN